MSSPAKRQKKVSENSPHAKRQAGARSEEAVDEPAPAPAPLLNRTKSTSAAASRSCQAAARSSGRSRGQLLVGAIGSRSRVESPSSPNGDAQDPAPACAKTQKLQPAPDIPRNVTKGIISAEPSNALWEVCEELGRSLPLPDEYRRLQDRFIALETTLSFFRSRGEPCFFKTLCDVVEKNTQREFDARMLRLLLGVWPDAFSVEVVAIAASKASTLHSPPS